MAEVTYRSNVRIERLKGPVRRAYLPAETAPVIFGVHGAVAEHYKVPKEVLDPHATTLDYIVAALRVHGFFADKCPVYRSLKAAIDITTELVLEPVGD